MANNTQRIHQRNCTEELTKYGRDGSVDCVGLECIDDSVLIRLVSYLIQCLDRSALYHHHMMCVHYL